MYNAYQTLKAQTYTDYLNFRSKWRVMVEKHTTFDLITQVRTKGVEGIALSDKWAGSPNLPREWTVRVSSRVCVGIPG